MNVEVVVSPDKENTNVGRRVVRISSNEEEEEEEEEEKDFIIVYCLLLLLYNILEKFICYSLYCPDILV